MLELGRSAAQRPTSSGTASGTNYCSDRASPALGRSSGGYDRNTAYESDWAAYADYDQGCGPKYDSGTSDHDTANATNARHADNPHAGNAGQHAAGKYPDTRT